jgi:hypothetical protein
MVTSEAFNTETGDLNISLGNAAAEYEYNYEVNFDNKSWKPKLIGFEIHASQNYVPLGGEVKLKTTFSYAGKSMSNLITWGTFDFGDAKFADNIFSVSTTTSGQKIKVNLLYTVPQVAVLTAICQFSVELKIVFESVTSNPGPAPDPNLPPPEVTQDGSDPPDYSFDFFGLKIDPKWVLAGAGVLAAVLIARPSAPVTILRDIRR